MSGVTTTRRRGITAAAAVKIPVKAATTANITLSGEQTIDGIACTDGDRVLVKDQTDASENGIYQVDTSAWSREPDWDGALDVRQGTVVYVLSGDTNGGFWAVSTADPIVPGTTDVEFADVFSLITNTVQHVANATALRAIIPASGTVLRLHCISTEGDGGAGEVEGVTGAAPGTYTDDNKSTFLPTGGDGSSAWLRRDHSFIPQYSAEYLQTISDIKAGEVDLLRFIPRTAHSAIRDFTSTTDVASYIQAAVDAGGQDTGQSAEGLRIIAPYGKLVVQSEIDWYSGIHLIGQGMRATVFSVASISATHYFIKTANNANNFSFSGFSVDGGGNANAAGGIYIGNGSGEAGYTAYFSLRDLEVRAFTAASAGGIVLSNPSHGDLTNVRSDGHTNGYGLLALANMTNTGVISLNGCKFGARTDTHTGVKLLASSSASAALDAWGFYSCFMGGGTRSLHLAAVSGGATEHRQITFDVCHFETDNATAGAEAILIECGSNVAFLRPRIHLFYNTEHGIRFNHAGAVEGIDIIRPEFVRLPTSGQCIDIGTGGAGSYDDIRIQAPTVSDPESGTYTILQDGGYHSTLIPKEKFQDWTDGDTTPDVFGYKNFRTQNTTGATSVTDFDVGTNGGIIPDGYVIHVYAGDGNTTIVHGSGIVTNTGANKALTINKIYTFHHRQGTWFEQE